MSHGDPILAEIDPRENVTSIDREHTATAGGSTATIISVPAGYDIVLATAQITDANSRVLYGEVSVLDSDMGKHTLKRGPLSSGNPEALLTWAGYIPAGAGAVSVEMRVVNYQVVDVDVELRVLIRARRTVVR